MSSVERGRAAGRAAPEALLAEIEETRARLREVKLAVNRIRQFAVEARAMTPPKPQPGATWRRWKRKISNAIARRRFIAGPGGPVVSDAQQVENLKQQLESLAEAMRD